MKKTYFMINPEDFTMHSDIEKYGATYYQKCKPFDVEDPAENFIIFEVTYETINGKRKYDSVAKEVITGKEFCLKVFQDHSRNGEELFSLYSSKAGVFTNGFLSLKEAEVRPIRITGLFNYFRENEEPANKYYFELSEFFENARAFKYIYDHGVNGPSNYLIRSIRRSYKKNRRG